MQNWFQLLSVCCCCCLWCAHGKQGWGISENILLCVWEWPESRCYLMGEWHRAGGWRSKHTHAHTPSLLFSFLVAWELAKGPQTSHQEGGKRWGEEEENRPGNILYHWVLVLANSDTEFSPRLRLALSMYVSSCSIMSLRKERPVWQSRE